MAPNDPWRAVGRAMAFGSAFDFVFAVAILGFTRPAARLLGLAVPDDPVYLGLCGVLLTILAGLYALAAIEPRRYSGIAPVSAGGRLLGSLLFAWAWRGGRPPVFLALSIADLAIALVTVVAWSRARGTSALLETSDP